MLANPTPETAKAYINSLTALREAGKGYTAAEKTAQTAQNAALEAARQVEIAKQAAVDALMEEAKDQAWQEVGGSQGNSAPQPGFFSTVGRKSFDLVNQLMLGIPAGYGADGKGKPFAEGMDQTEPMQSIQQEEDYDMASLLASSDFDQKPSWETMPSDHLTYSVEETPNGLTYYYSHGILEPGDIVPDPEGNPVVFEGWVPDSQTETFAGHESGDSIRDIERLVTERGGTYDQWEKRKREGIVTRSHIDGEEETGYVSFHWYYEPTIGIVERKIKEDDNKKIWFRPKIKMY